MIELPPLPIIWPVNRRQIQSLKQRCDLYKPTTHVVNPPTKEGGDLQLPVDPTYSNVPCAFHSTPEIDVPKPQGRTKEINIFTLDKFIIPQGIEIYDGWGVVIRDPDIL